MCFSSHHTFQDLIISLNSGDVVIVSGIDQDKNTLENKKLVVLKVSGASFLTTTGEAFGCQQISSLEKTGEHQTVLKPNEKALRLLAAAESRQLARERGLVETGVLEVFDKEPE